MDVDELRRKIEAQGYEVRNIRVFKRSFHVNYWTSSAKMRAFYKVPLSSVTWRDLKDGFPKVEEA